MGAEKGRGEPDIRYLGFWQKEIESNNTARYPDISIKRVLTIVYNRINGFVDFVQSTVF
jgi:hypothetical protein